MRWWGWALLAWLALAPPVGVLVGRVIRSGQHAEACGACQHARQAHEHYRLGADCGLCGCPAYRPARPRNAQTTARWRPGSRSVLRWAGLPVPRRPPG